MMKVLSPVSIVLTLEEAVALACVAGEVTPERLDSARLSTPLERRIAAEERALLSEEEEEEEDDEIVEGPPPGHPAWNDFEQARDRAIEEEREYDSDVEAYPDEPMWVLVFGRWERTSQGMRVSMHAKEFRIVGEGRMRSLPASGIQDVDPREATEVIPGIDFPRALHLASNAVAMPSTMVHAGHYVSEGRVAEGGTKWERAHWSFEFGWRQGEFEGGLSCWPTAYAYVFEDGRIEIDRWP